MRNERHAEDQRRAGKLAKAGRKTKSGSLKTQLTLAKQGIDKPLADRARKAAAMSVRTTHDAGMGGVGARSVLN